MKRPVAWLIRPWIFDFTAYDQFAQPRGFLMLAGYLRDRGVEVHYIDCLERPDAGKLRIEASGCGEYTSQIAEKPRIFAGIPRYYRRFGWRDDELIHRLNLLPAPGVILMTTGMTYWYDSLIHLSEILSKNGMAAPSAWGGVYATLAPDHARRLGYAEIIQKGDPGELFFQWISDRTGVRVQEADYRQYIQDHPPAWDLIPGLRYGILISSRGCLCGCGYCGSGLMHTGFTRQSLDQMAQEIAYLTTSFHIRHFSFQDDDLGQHSPADLKDFLEILPVSPHGLTWHLPNAINAEALDERTSRMMFGLGFMQIRLSLPHLDRNLSADGLSARSLQTLDKARLSLDRAGYGTDQISMYIIAGLPGQKLDWLKKCVQQLLNLGIKPYFSQYSPIPGTALGETRLKDLAGQLPADLHLTNKILSVYRHSGWSGKDFLGFAAEVKEFRKKISGRSGRLESFEIDG